MRRRIHGLQLLYEKSQDEAVHLQEYVQSLDLQIDTLAEERDRLWEISDHDVVTFTDQMSEEHAKASAVTIALKRQIDELRARNKDLDSRCEALEQEWVQSEDALEESRCRIQSLTNERDNAVVEKEHAQEEQDKITAQLQNFQALSSNVPGVGNESELGRWLGILLPNLNLTSASISKIHRELRDPVPVFRLLEQLTSRPESLRGDNLHGKGKAGWVEMHFNTGEDDRGRLYYYGVGGHGFQVHIGHKRTQPEDFGQIRAMTREIEDKRAQRRSTTDVASKV